MSEQKCEYAKYLGTKVFSNKKYKIRVKLFDHGLAEAEIDYKKRKTLDGFLRFTSMIVSVSVYLTHTTVSPCYEIPDISEDEEIIIEE